MPDAAPQRSDALKNREAILQVAHDALAESADASLNSIAKRAGVGPGTLYRHFPTREALILEVYRRDVDRLVDSVPDVLAGPSPAGRTAAVVHHPRRLCAPQARPRRGTAHRRGAGGRGGDVRFRHRRGRPAPRRM